MSVGEDEKEKGKVKGKDPVGGNPGPFGLSVRILNSGQQ